MAVPRVTLDDIAIATGLGRTTISDILNRKGTATRYSTATRQRVEAAVADLGYAPARAAQQLVQGRSGLIGLMLTRDFSNPFFARVADRVERELRDRGYRLQIAVTDGCADTELLRIRQFHGDAVEGLIVGPVYETLDLEQHRQIFRGQLPTVLFGRPFGSEFDEVGADGDAGWQLAVDHLLGRGHRRIAFLCAPTSRVDPSDNASYGALSVMRAADVLRPEWVVWHPDTGRYEEYFNAADGLAARWLATAPADRPTAVLCHNDQVATTALAAFHARGVRVPEDVSVVGHDNLPEGGYLLPALTTVDDRVDRQMAAAVAQLLERIESPDAQRKVISVAPELVERRSVHTLC